MMFTTTPPSTTAAAHRAAAVLLGLVLLLPLAAAGQSGRSELLVPSFAVDLDGGTTSLFSLVNPTSGTAHVKITVRSNWGVEILSTMHELAPYASRSYDVADWLVRGKLPDRQLGDRELEAAQAALSGQPTPAERLSYSTEKTFRTALGSLYVTSDRDLTFGDFLSFDPAGNNAAGDQLVDKRPRAQGAASSTCRRHAIRFSTGGPMRTDTEIVVRSDRRSRPSSSPYYPEDAKIATRLSIYSMSGELIEVRELSCLPLDVLKVSDLGLTLSNGWIDMELAEETFASVRYTADERFSVGLRTACLPAAPAGPNTVLGSAYGPIEGPEDPEPPEENSENTPVLEVDPPFEPVTDNVPALEEDPPFDPINEDIPVLEVDPPFDPPSEDTPVLEEDPPFDPPSDPT